MRAHALLSASGADRWMGCPPSARLEDTLPDSTSVFAQEGTLAHDIAELKLRKHFMEPMSPQAFSTEMAKLKDQELYSSEMQGYTDEYLEQIKEIAMSYPKQPLVSVERRLDFSLFVPEGFGTGDCVLVGGNTLNVVDFKYGKGVPVSAENNSQMRLYALGALTHYRQFYDIQEISMTIVQPRLNNISKETMLRDDLLNWGQFEVKPRAELAFAGDGEFCAGDWCRFCRAGAQCRTRAGFLPALEEFATKDQNLLSNAEIGDLLARAQPLKNWLTTIEDFALSQLLKGEAVAGWKAVEGRSNRRFVDVDKAFSALEATGIDRSVLYINSPITLTAAEKLVGKKEFETVAGEYVEKPMGKPTLATMDDKRDIYSISAAIADFNTN